MLTSLLHRGLAIVAPGRAATDRLRNLVALPRGIRADREHAHTLADEIHPGGERQLAVVGDRPLDPSDDSASHRLGWLLRMALLDGYRISFYSVRARRWYGVESEDLRLTPLEPPVAATVVWVVRPEAGAIAMPALRLLRPRPRVVYDTMDLHHLRLERESAVTGSRGLALQARLMRELERQVASSADVAIAITSDEAPRLARLAGKAQVVVLPNVHLPRPGEPAPLGDRAGLLFVGNYTHTPNVDAVDVLVREVMPRLWRERPELRLSVAGRGFPAERLAGLDPRVAVLDWVEDIDGLADRSAILVAPLRFGAGLKGKIGLALARGLPVVTTPVGAEGFGGRLGMVVTAQGDWDAFAACTLELLDDPNLWARTSAAGIALTRRDYAPDVLAARLRRILEP